MMTVLFFFQAEEGIRDKLVTGVQTCALPISAGAGVLRSAWMLYHRRGMSFSSSSSFGRFSLAALCAISSLPGRPMEGPDYTTWTRAPPPGRMTSPTRRGSEGHGPHTGAAARRRDDRAIHADRPDGGHPAPRAHQKPRGLRRGARRGRPAG